MHHRNPAVWRHLKAKRRQRQSDLNIRPLMNLFMVLVPFLLLYSSFVEMSVLHSAVTEPGGRVSAELRPGLILEMDRQGYQLISHNCDLKQSIEKQSPVAGRTLIRLTQAERPQLLAYLSRL